MVHFILVRRSSLREGRVGSMYSSAEVERESSMTGSCFEMQVQQVDYQPRILRVERCYQSLGQTDIFFQLHLMQPVFCASLFAALGRRCTNDIPNVLAQDIVVMECPSMGVDTLACLQGAGQDRRGVAIVLRTEDGEVILAEGSRISDATHLTSVNNVCTSTVDLGSREDAGCNVPSPRCRVSWFHRSVPARDTTVRLSLEMAYLPPSDPP
ncbi:hypothetical protein KC325_g205 [Hortaea werneckii]|nr:hypothetical protein KC325_g205 [Hortaea werneckii]